MIEIQIHPSDIRKKVRYFFFTGRQLKLMALGVVGLIFFFTWAILVAPQSFTHQVKKARVAQEIRNSTAFKNKIQVMVNFFAKDSEALEKDRQRLENLYYVFGIPLRSSGQGGMTLPSAPAKGVPNDKALPLWYERVREQTAVCENLCEELNARAAYFKSLTHAVPSICPIPAGSFVVTSAFGYRINPFTGKQDFHQGLDFACPEGTPIWSVGDGTVTYAGRYPLSTSVAWWRYGNIVVVEHENSFITIYAHLGVVGVRTGEKVRRWQKVGTSGNTGWSTRPHLHYEIRTNMFGETFAPIDPRIYILDLNWQDMDKILAQARNSLGSQFEPLPSTFRR
jgi:murein DD-endopeptidase MepM/ murein hydrolase activator NlpD